jgi:hypothetical protein
LLANAEPAANQIDIGVFRLVIVPKFDQHCVQPRWQETRLEAVTGFIGQIHSQAANGGA